MINNSRGLNISGMLDVEGNSLYGRFEGSINGKRARRKLNATKKGFFISHQGKRVYFDDVMELMI